MIRLFRWAARPWVGLREAKAELANSEADQASVRELADAMRRYHEENHITRRVHEALRGGRP